MRRTVVIAVSILLVSTVGAGARAQAAPSPGGPDFNGDGFADLATGDSAETVAGQNAAGAVNVIYGGANGLASAGNQLFTQASPGVPTDPEPEGLFGESVAAGDFNGDGFSDLAIGVPEATVNGQGRAGEVLVLYGTRAGLTSNGSQLFDQDTEQVLGTADAQDEFGMSLAAGRFGRSAQDDLAIGVTNEAVDGIAGAGAVQVLYGSLTGLSPNGNQLWTQNSAGMPGDGAEADDNFGAAFGQGGILAAGDFGKDAHQDLAIGDPQEDVGVVVDAGSVTVLYGGSGGLSTAAAQVWTQDSPGVPDAAESSDLFGSALASGDFGGNAHDDLAIGAAGEAIGANAGCGAVDVLYGSNGGLTTANAQLFSQNTAGVKDQCDPPGALNGDLFGLALAAADLGKSAQADLAIGVAGEDVGQEQDAGAVEVLYGSPTGLTTAGNQFWNQDSPGVADVAEGPSGSPAGDVFGNALLAADFGRTGQADLAVGVLGEDLVGNTLPDAGAISVLYGAAGGLSANGDQFWNQDSPGIKDQAEAGDEFGTSLAAAP